MSVLTIEQLAAQTSACEEAVPAIRGALPDFSMLLGADAIAVREVYLLGTIKSGKSTLVNALLGRDVMPRGAGVKTFNLTRAQPSDEPGARILFHSGEQLRDRFEFDFRMLGFAFDVPENPYSQAGTDALQDLLVEFERACAQDERLADVDADASLLGLLPRSLARIRRSIAGLVELQRTQPDAVRARIAEDAVLEFDADAFDGYLAWTESMDIAALVRGIELGLPYPQGDDGLPANIELVDCQGSDSLNPLDFADVESIVQRADLIVYVIQSRLGLRQGDRDLLRHLALAGAAQRVLAVLNVDAFDPLGGVEFEALTERVRADVERVTGASIELIALSSLAELDRRLGDAEELDLMRMLWRRRDAEGELERLLAGAGRLRSRLGALAAERPDEQVARDQRLAGLLQQARTAATALLARDQRLLGTDASGMPRAEAVAAVQRLLDGEVRRVREDAAREVDAALGAEGALQQELDTFLATAGLRYARQHPVPETLLEETHGVRVVDAALARFNEDWLGGDSSARRANLSDLRGWFSRRMLEGVERIERMLPDSARALTDGGAGRGVRLAPARALEELVAQIPIPLLQTPVVLPGALRQALLAEFVSRGLLARIRGGRGTGDASEASAHRVDTLWRRTLAAAFRQAAEDREHALASARENYKFQYCYRIGDRFVAALATEMLACVEQHHAQLGRLAEARRLLLDDIARDQLVRYLQVLDAAPSVRVD